MEVSVKDIAGNDLRREDTIYWGGKEQDGSITFNMGVIEAIDEPGNRVCARRTIASRRPRPGDDEATPRVIENDRRVWVAAWKVGRAWTPPPPVTSRQKTMTLAEAEELERRVERHRT